MTAEEILGGIPAFADAPASQDIFLSLADSLTADAGDNVWNNDDNLRALAVALRAAHMMAGMGLGTNTASFPGPVTSRHIGELSVTYGTIAPGTAADFALLMTTPYGRQLIDLMQATIMAPITAYG